MVEGDRWFGRISRDDVYGAGGADGVAHVQVSTTTTRSTPPKVSWQVTARPRQQVSAVVSGTARVGRSISTSNGTWTGTAPIGFTYQWLPCDSGGNNCVSIAGATTSTYLIKSTDRSHRLRSRVTAKNTVGSASATSAATGAVAAR